MQNQTSVSGLNLDPFPKIPEAWLQPHPHSYISTTHRINPNGLSFLDTGEHITPYIYGRRSRIQVLPCKAGYRVRIRGCKATSGPYLPHEVIRLALQFLPTKPSREEVLAYEAATGQGCIINGTPITLTDVVTRHRGQLTTPTLTTMCRLFGERKAAFFDLNGTYFIVCPQFPDGMPVTRLGFHHQHGLFDLEEHHANR